MEVFEEPLRDLFLPSMRGDLEEGAAFLPGPLGYWGVDAAELSIAQAATLAGIVRNPYEYNPQKNPEAVIERRNLVLEKMAEYGYITADEQKEAAESGLDLKPNVTPNGCASAGDLAYFCTYVESAVLTDERFGATPEERKETLR